MYPVCLDIRGKLCVVVGGGKVAERKIHGLLAAGAEVRLISPELTPDLAGLADRDEVEWRPRSFAEGDLEGALLVFAATNDRLLQQQICSLTRANGQLVNVADDPECCSFHVPAILRRGSLLIAVSTNGKSPAVSAMIREKLAGEFGSEYEGLLAIMAMVRQHQGELSAGPDERKKIYKKILHDDIVDWIREKRSEVLRQHLYNVLGPGFRHDIDELIAEIL